MAGNRLSKWDKAHLHNIAVYQKQVEELYDQAAQEVAGLAAFVGELGDKPFSWKDYPLTKQGIEKIINGLYTNLAATIANGINLEWQLSDKKNDELATTMLGDHLKDLSEKQQKLYFAATATAAGEAFIKRKTNGLTLSERVWNYTQGFKQEMELALDCGIRDGKAASRLARDLKQYLRYPDKLFRRVRNEHGQLVLSKAAKAFHPGRGVYRSSYMNARRLAATETNIAYRTADHERWQAMDFVVGIRVVLSNNHNCKGFKPGTFHDICDDLSAPIDYKDGDKCGLYPKDFKFTGWHPLCRCHAVPVLKTQEEFLADMGYAEENKSTIELTSENNAKSNDFDEIENYYLPKDVREKVSNIERLKTFNEFKAYFNQHGISLTTNYKSLLDRADEPIENVTNSCKRLAIGVETYKSLFGKDALRKLKVIKIGDKQLDSQAAYFFNRIGEKDPLAGTLCIRSLSCDGRTVFHELAHAFQDSMAKRSEDAVLFAAKMVKKAMLSEKFFAYAGAASDVMEAERFADAFAYGFYTGNKDGLAFVKNVWKSYHPSTEKNLSIRAVVDVPNGFKKWIENNTKQINNANSLPYFIKDNYKGRLKDYANYKEDYTYTNVSFNYRNGGLKATHINHVETAEAHAKERKYFASKGFDGYTGKDLEVLCQKELYKNGYSCILVDDKIKDASGKTKTALDTLTNGMYTDIRSITEDGDNTIKNAIKTKIHQLHKFNKINEANNNQLILYFHDDNFYHEDKVEKALRYFQAKGTSLKRIFCVLRRSGKVVEIK